MSKAVSISEGGKGRIFPQTDKLKINNVGGGNSLWLPEDEVVTGTLYADENGIYLAENDGFSCYDTVVVRVEDETDPDDPDWELDPDDLDENVWDEESYEEYQEDPEAFEEKYNDKEKWKAEKAKKEKSQKIKKVKSLKPSKITGIDPVDGNPYQVGVDSEGNLTKEMLPSSIHIVVPPWKREYEEGEEINFYGMHVYLLDKDGHPFKSEKYPTGEIPFEELLIPVTTAEGEEGGGAIHVSDGDGINAMMLSPTGEVDPWGVATYTSVGGFYVKTGKSTGLPIYFTKYQNKVYCAGASGYDFGSLIIGDDQGSISIYGYFNSDYFGGGYNVEGSRFYSWVPESTVDPSNVSKDDMKSSGGEVTVSWIRSDGEILEDKFIISVSNTENAVSRENSTEPINNSESGHTSGGF